MKWISLLAVLIVILLTECLLAKSSQDADNYITRFMRVVNGHIEQLVEVSRSSYQSIFGAIPSPPSKSDSPSKSIEFTENEAHEGQGESIQAEVNMEGTMNNNDSPASSDKIPLADLLAILESNPDDRSANQLMGAYLLKDKPEMAEKFLYNAVELSEWTDATSILYLAECERMLGNLDAAESVAYRGLQIVREEDTSLSSTFSFLIGSISADQQNFTAAAEWYLAAAIGESMHVMAWQRASTLQFPPEHVNLKFAENVLLEAFKFLPEEPSILFYLGIILQRTDRIDQAVPLFEAALSYDPNSLDVLSSLAVAYHATQMFPAARQAYLTYLAQEPDDLGMRTNLAALLMEMEEYDEARRVVKEVLSADPQFISAQQVLEKLDSMNAR